MDGQAAAFQKPFAPRRWTAENAYYFVHRRVLVVQKAETTKDTKVNEGNQYLSTVYAPFRGHR